MRFILLPGLLACSHLCAAPADTGRLDARRPTSELTPNQVSQALSAVKENFIRPEALSQAALDRATLDGLLDRLEPEVTLSTGAAGTGPAAPFYSELYQEHTGYLRPGNVTPENIAKAREALANWALHGVGAVILDLRSTQPSSDFAAAAQLESFFCPKGTEMFSLRTGPGKTTGNGSGSTATPGSKIAPSVSISSSSTGALFVASGDPLFTGILVVLVDTQTAEAPEAVAASLQKRAKALVVGEKTAGRAFEYRDFPLDGSTLRVAVGMVLLPDGREPGETGFKPDIEVPGDPAAKPGLVKSVSEKGIGSVIQEYDRPHLNEAALVAHSNPEVDELEAEESGKKPAGGAVDRQLERALDLVTSIAIYRGKSG